MHTPPSSLIFRCCLFVLVLLLLGGCSGDPEKKKAVHYEKAMAYVQEKNPSAAIIELRNAIQVDPKYAAARYQLGLLYLQAGEETSRQMEIYIGVIFLYFISAMAINRIMAFIEKRVRVPGFVAASGGGGH